MVQSLVATKLAEDPGDFFAGRLLKMVGALARTALAFYTRYFAAHGMLHVVVVGARLNGAAWAHSFAILVLIAFAVDQTIDWMTAGGTMFLVLNAIDLLVIPLALIEWRARQPA